MQAKNAYHLLQKTSYCFVRDIDKSARFFALSKCACTLGLSGLLMIKPSTVSYMSTAFFPITAALY
jgi:citrate lyase beta subunit